MAPTTVPGDQKLHMTCVDQDGVEVVIGINNNVIDSSALTSAEFFTSILQPCSGMMWKNRATVIAVIENFAPKFGFRVNNRNSEILCHCAGKRRSQPGKQRHLDGGSLKMGCKWKVNLSSCVRWYPDQISKYKLELSKGHRKVDLGVSTLEPHNDEHKEQNQVSHTAVDVAGNQTRIASPPRKFGGSEPPSLKKRGTTKPVFYDFAHVKIGKCFFEHTNGCNPCAQQLIAATSRSGKYVSSISDYATFFLCRMLYKNPAFSSSAIKDVLSENYPEGKVVTKQDVFYTRVRCRRLLKLYENNQRFESFQMSLQSTNLAKGIDEDSITEDECLTIGKEIWRTLLDSDRSHEENLTCFQDYMKAMKQNVRGFDYRLAADTKGFCNGIVWITSTMRENFRRFGTFISLDAMKRGLNKLLWPYFAVVMMNDVNKICLACEAILCSERNEAYAFLISSLMEMSHGSRSSDHIYVVAGDGFITQESLGEWGLPNAHYVTDQWHLFTKTLPHRFGIYYFSIIEGDLRCMANALSQEYFETHYEKALTNLRNLNRRNTAVEMELAKFRLESGTYAMFEINKYQGSLSRKGSSCSESNNSSALSFLNQGEKGTNKYCNYPHVFIHDLLKREAQHTKVTNQILWKGTNNLRCRMSELDALDVDDSIRKMLKDAANLQLVWDSYCEFEKMAIEEVKYYEKIVSVDESGTQCFKIQRRGSNATPRIFYNAHDKCSCAMYVGKLMQCTHKIVMRDNKFCIDDFGIRHHYRSKVGVCYGDVTEGSIMATVEADIPKMNVASLTDNCDADEEVDFDADKEVDWSKSKQNTNQSSSAIARPLSIRTLQQLQNGMNANYTKASREIQMFVGAMTISLEKLVLGEGNDEIVNKDHNDIHTKMNAILEHYSSALCPTSGAFAGILPVAEPNQNVTRKQSHQRLRTTMETKARKAARAAGINLKCSNAQPFSVRQNKKKTSSCSFCGSGNGHKTKNNCPIRAAIIAECGGEISSAQEKDSLLQRIRCEMPIAPPPDKAHVITTNPFVGEDCIHLKILECYAKMKSQTYGFLRENEMILAVSIIGKSGTVAAADMHRFVDGTDISAFIHSIRKKKDRFVYDYTGTQEMLSGKFSRSMGSQHDTSIPEIKRFKDELYDTMQNHLAQQQMLPHTSSHLHTGTYLTNLPTITYQPENIFQPYTRNQHGGSTNNNEGIRKGSSDQVDLDDGMLL